MTLEQIYMAVRLGLLNQEEFESKVSIMISDSYYDGHEAGYEEALHQEVNDE